MIGKPLVGANKLPPRQALAPPPLTLDQFLSRYGISASEFAEPDAFGHPRRPYIGVGRIPVFAEGRFYDLPGQMTAKEFMQLIQMYKGSTGTQPTQRIRGL